MNSLMSKINNKNLIIIGKIGAPYGVKGWVKVHSFTDPKSNILSYDNWLLIGAKKHQTEQIFKVIEARPHGNSFVAQLENIDVREDAALLTNLEIAINREDLVSTSSLPNQYYWHDLIGLEVHDTNGILLGTVNDFFDTGANDVMVVEGVDSNNEKTEHLIPFVMERHIIDVNLDVGRIVVDWEF